MLGGLYDKAGLHARAGWMGSRGLYADVSGDLPLFFSGVVDNASLSNLLSAGLRRLNTPSATAGEAYDGAGLLTGA